jgi:hypothetical protein
MLYGDQEYAVYLLFHSLVFEYHLMNMLIRSNEGNDSIPLIQNTLNDKHFDDIVYDDPDKCELLNK